MCCILNIEGELNGIACEVETGIKLTVFAHCEFAALEVRVYDIACSLNNLCC